MCSAISEGVDVVPEAVADNSTVAVCNAAYTSVEVYVL